MKWLNYHHLYYFWQIAHEGGIARAAEKLRLGQPTLSTQLKQLEEALGHPLFERRGRSLWLTEGGKVALDYANEIFRLGDEFLQVIDEQKLSSRSTLRLGALDSVPKSLILSLVNAAQKIADCTVTILEGSGDELIRELVAHKLDLMLSNYPPMGEEQRRVYSRSLAKVPVSLYGASPFAKLSKNFPRSLDSQPLLLPTPHSKLRIDLDHFFAVNKLRVKMVAETQDTSLQKLMGIEGKGLVPLPEFAVKELVRAKRLKRIGRLDGVYEEYWLLSGSRKIENPVSAELAKNFTIEVN